MQQNFSIKLCNSQNIDERQNAMKKVNNALNGTSMHAELVSETNRYRAVGHKDISKEDELFKVVLLSLEQINNFTIKPIYVEITINHTDLYKYFDIIDYNDTVYIVLKKNTLQEMSNWHMHRNIPSGAGIDFFKAQLYIKLNQAINIDVCIANVFNLCPCVSELTPVQNLCKNADGTITIEVADSSRTLTPGLGKFGNCLLIKNCCGVEYGLIELNSKGFSNGNLKLNRFNKLIWQSGSYNAPEIEEAFNMLMNLGDFVKINGHMVFH